MSTLSGLLNFCFKMTKNDRHFFLLRKISAWLYPEYRYKWPQLAWWKEGRFNDYLQSFEETGGLNTDRRWMVAQLLRLTEKIPGDTAECGVFKGASSYLIAQFLKQNNKINAKHHAFDSFEGLSVPAGVDGRYWKKGDLSANLEDTMKNLAAVDNVIWHKGWIPEKFPEVADAMFSFVHIDVDIYEPTRDAIQFFYPRMSNGGIMVCDDYGSTFCPGAAKAIDEFLADKPEKMISLCCGGGFMIKSCQTAGTFSA